MTIEEIIKYCEWRHADSVKELKQYNSQNSFMAGVIEGEKMAFEAVLKFIKEQAE